MDAFDKWIVIATVVIVAIVAVAIALDDILEKKWALERGLCQVARTGSQSWSWQTCPKGEK